jgi:kynurenine formamidase
MMCELEIIDSATKGKIAAFCAQFRQATSSPFGRDDQIGMLNLIDAHSRAVIMDRADAGTMFDLSVDYFVGMPSWAPAGDPGYQIFMTHTPRGTELDDASGAGLRSNQLASYSGDAISMYTHCGTHVDTLNHFGYRGEIFNNFTPQDHLGSRHWQVSGADKQPPILARGVLLDVAAAVGVDILPPSYAISVTDIRNCLRRQRISLRVGDVVMIRTGQMQLWPDGTRYMTDEPGLTVDSARFLAEQGAIMIGSDTISLECRPSPDPDNWNPVHCLLLAEAGVAILEVADLEQLAAECVYEFAFFGACIRLRGATGAPMRPLAMPLRD